MTVRPPVPVIPASWPMPLNGTMVKRSAGWPVLPVDAE